MNTRRDFLRQGFAMGGLLATASLPAWGEDDPALFPVRGQFERLSVSYAHVHIGLQKPFSVLHISDTHLTAAYPHESQAKQELRRKRSRTFGGMQEQALRETLEWAKKNVDHVVHTGDLIDWQSEANFDLVKRYFGVAAGAMFGSLGNHEYSRSMWLDKYEPTEAYKDGTRALVAAAFPFDTSLQSTVVNGVNFVALDDVFGTVTAAQVARFKAEVAKGLPIVLCMHVPFHTDHTWRATHKYWRLCGKRFTTAEMPPRAGDCIRQANDPVTRDFIAYLKTEKLLRCILAGHEHIDVQDAFSPTAMEYITGGNFMFHGREVLFT